MKRTASEARLARQPAAAAPGERAALDCKMRFKEEDKDAEDDIEDGQIDESLCVKLINNATIEPFDPFDPLTGKPAPCSFGHASEDCNNMQVWLKHDANGVLAKVSLFYNRPEAMWALSETVWAAGGAMPAPQKSDEFNEDHPNRAARAANELYRAYLDAGFVVAGKEDARFFSVHESEHDGEELEEEEDEEDEDEDEEDGEYE